MLSWMKLQPTLLSTLGVWQYHQMHASEVMIPNHRTRYLFRKTPVWRQRLFLIKYQLPQWQNIIYIIFCDIVTSAWRLRSKSHQNIRKMSTMCLFKIAWKGKTKGKGFDKWLTNKENFLQPEMAKNARRPCSHVTSFLSPKANIINLHHFKFFNQHNTLHTVLEDQWKPKSIFPVSKNNLIFQYIKVA